MRSSGFLSQAYHKYMLYSSLSLSLPISLFCLFLFCSLISCLLEKLPDTWIYVDAFFLMNDRMFGICHRLV